MSDAAITLTFLVSYAVGAAGAGLIGCAYNHLDRAEAEAQGGVPTDSWEWVFWVAVFWPFFLAVLAILGAGACLNKASKLLVKGKLERLEREAEIRKMEEELL